MECNLFPVLFKPLFGKSSVMNAGIVDDQIDLPFFTRRADDTLQEINKTINIDIFFILDKHCFTCIIDDGAAILILIFWQDA